MKERLITTTNTESCNFDGERQTHYVHVWLEKRGPRVLRVPYAGEVLYIYGGRTEEGWTRNEDLLVNDGATLRRTAFSDGSDCDGRLNTVVDLVCHPADIKGHHAAPLGIYPMWHHQDDYYQRDYFAESMGY